ncbi:hypothetical protein C9926_01765, partial [Sulfurovum lithotrophicum]
KNQGIAYWDQDGDGNVDYNASVVTDDPALGSQDDPTEVTCPNCSTTPVCPIDPTPICPEPTTEVSTPNTPAMSGTTIIPLLGGETLVSFSQATHGQVTLNDGEDDTLVYIPNPGYVGTDSFTYITRDINGNEMVRTATVTVAPVITSRGETLDILGIGESLISFTQPSYGVIVLDDGGTPDDLTDDALRYLPNDGYSGLDSFSYTIRDNAGNVVTKTMTFTVDGVKSDSGDALDKLSIMLLMFFTCLIGLYYVRREEMSIKKEK